VIDRKQQTVAVTYQNGVVKERMQAFHQPPHHTSVILISCPLIVLLLLLSGNVDTDVALFVFDPNNQSRRVKNDRRVGIPSLYRNPEPNHVCDTKVQRQSTQTSWMIRMRLPIGCRLWQHIPKMGWLLAKVSTILTPLFPGKVIDRRPSAATSSFSRLVHVDP
jgi:hypothetical protein